MTDAVERAVAILRGGGLVAFPTETVYGLGADATNAEAVGRIFTAKGRPADRPLTVLLGPSADPAPWVHWTEGAARLAERFWPGPLTLVLPLRRSLPDAVTATGSTLGLRVPDHPVAIELLERFGGGIAAPSANRSGQLSPTSADHVRQDLGDRVDLVLDGGPCAVGLESTVLSLVAAPTVLRAGALSTRDLEAVLDRTVVQPDSAPGRKLKTPATRVPRARVLAAVAAHEQGSVGVLWCGALPPSHQHDAGWIALPADPERYAQGLYQALRQLDEAGHARLFLVDPPAESGWSAVLQMLDRT